MKNSEISRLVQARRQQIATATTPAEPAHTTYTLTRPGSTPWASAIAATEIVAEYYRAERIAHGHRIYRDQDSELIELHTLLGGQSDDIPILPAGWPPSSGNGEEKWENEYP